MKVSAKNKRLVVAIALVAVLAVCALFTASNFANADTTNSNTNTEGTPSEPNDLAAALNWVLYYIVATFGWILGKLIIVLVDNIVLFNDFVNVRLVEEGWRIIRDICNNFFIVILLVISVGTILRAPGYQYKQLLPKLLIMAVLINFSKMITGVLIDFFQIIMVFFASALTQGESGVALILGSVGLHKLYNLYNNGQNQTNDLKNYDVTKALIFALILSIIATVVIAVTAILLVYRIVMLWFLIILSPAAYFLATFPKGQQYAGMWWSQLASNLIVGPVLLFFLYLAFFSGYRDIGGASGTTGSNPTINRTQTSASQINKDFGVGSEMAQPASLFDFMIIIGMMVGGLIMAQKVGAAGGQWAGKGVATIQKMGKGGAKFGGRVVGRGAAGVASYATGKIPSKVPLIGKGKLVNAWSSDVAKSMDNNAQKRRTAIMSKLKMGNATKEWIASKKDTQKKYGRKAGAVAGGIIGGAAYGLAGAGPLGLLVGGLLGGAVGFLKNPGKHTVAAAESETKTVQNAKRKADALNDTTASGSGDPMGLVEARSSWKGTGAYIGAGGILSKENNKMLDSISDDGLAHLSQAINTEPDATKRGDLIEAFTKMLAAYKKGKGSNWSTVASFLGSGKNVLGISDSANLDPLISSNKVDVASRRTGTEKFKEQRGDLYMARFKHFKDNTEAGIDFRSLFGDNQELLEQIKAQQPDFDISQSGLHIEGKEMTQKISQAMAAMIDKELASLSKNSAIAPADEREQIGRRMGTLRTAREQLMSGRLQQLQLWNSGLENETGEAATTAFHERIHKAGVKSESKTEEGARFIRERHLAGLHEEFGAEMAAMESERGGDNYTMEEVLGRVKEKHGTKERVQRVIAREQEAGVEPAEAKADGVKTQRVVAEIPEMGDLLEAVREINKGSGGAGVGLQFGLERQAGTQQDKIRLMNSLLAIEKGVGRISDDDVRGAASVVEGIRPEAVPLDVKVTTEVVQDSLT